MVVSEKGPRVFEEKGLISKYFVPFDEVFELSTEIARQIDPKEFDIVMGLANGGLAVSQIVYGMIRAGNPDLISVGIPVKNTKYSGGDGTILFPFFPEEELKGKRVLLCDEITDGGESLSETKAKLASIGAPSKVATMYMKEDADLRADYVGKKIPRTIEKDGKTYRNWPVFYWENDWSEQFRLP
jgi:hypoxanthine phosphoribosyltransferase